jgi:hypothetical protein
MNTISISVSESYVCIVRLGSSPYDSTGVSESSTEAAGKGRLSKDEQPLEGGSWQRGWLNAYNRTVNADTF